MVVSVACVFYFYACFPLFSWVSSLPFPSPQSLTPAYLTYINSLAHILSYFSLFSYKFLFVNFLFISQNEILLFMLFGMLFFSLHYILMLNIQQVKLIQD